MSQPQARPPMARRSAAAAQQQQAPAGTAGPARPRPPSVRPPARPPGTRAPSLPPHAPEDRASPQLSGRGSMDSVRSSGEFGQPVYPTVGAPARSPAADQYGGFGGQQFQQQQNWGGQGGWNAPPAQTGSMGMGGQQRPYQPAPAQQQQRASSPTASWYAPPQPVAPQGQQYTQHAGFQPSQQQPQQQQQQQQPGAGFFGQPQADLLSSTLQNFGMNPIASSLLSAPLQSAIGSQIQSHGAATVKGLKYYFDVSNGYVVKKIGTVLFPWRKGSWGRKVIRGDQGGVEGHQSPRADDNAPDLYVPVMGFVTYILLVGLLLGRANRFHPALLGSTASTAFAVLIFEVIMVRLGCYLLGVGSEGSEGWSDVIAILGYKFVGIDAAMLIKVLIPVSSVAYGFFVYAAFAHGFFLLRTLRSLVLPEQFKADQQVGTHVVQDKKRRVYFLFLIAAGAMFMSGVLLRVGWY